MALPGKKLSRSSKRRRASHFALKPRAIKKCLNCGGFKRPHYLCPNCLVRDEKPNAALKNAK